jgi:uncharacterized protein YndB with AHSA1/START domain
VTDELPAVLVVRRVIDAEPERVYAAWTTPERIRSWWRPGPVRCPAAEVDLRVGGRYRIANEFPDGRIIWAVGTFEEIEPPRRLVYSWRMGDAAVDSRVVVQFEARGGRTEVIVTHERLAPAIRKEHLDGWTGCLAGLAEDFSI